ncbi:hypothetical protein DRQ25_13270 [Candidatus Fermentibacteria bacterium]|nr:MAG: hypothetical protein DRQ25_13270 [Candidatus Fermentibacteria bacterium]
MQICFDWWMLVYLGIGMVYAGVKLWGGWEYHGKRSLYVRAHHTWFEVWFWPLDLFRLFIV